MAIERPKILTAIVADTAQSMKIYIDAGGTPVAQTFTAIPVGRYFVAGDAQSDDYLWKFCSTMQASIRTAGGGYASTEITGYIDADHKVNIVLTNYPAAQTLKLAWTESNGSVIGAYLGFDVSADDTFGPEPAKKTADYHHSHGWYADEDGYLQDKPLQDFSTVDLVQSRSHGGVVKTLQYSDQLYESYFDLFLITHEKTWSGGTAYTGTPSYPYNRNEALECWWQEASQGIEFRFYRNDSFDTARAIRSAILNTPGATTTTFTTSDYTVNQFQGWVMQSTNSNGDGFALRWYVTSNAAGSITAPNTWTHNIDDTANDYLFLVDARYKTYVLDLRRGGQKFEPQTFNQQLDRFSLRFDLLKYVAP